VLTGRELRSRFPAWHIDDDAAAVLQADGGFLRPEACILAHAARAVAAGARVHEGETLLHWEATPAGVHVQTNVGVYEASQLVLTAGAWMGTLLPGLAPLMRPERQVLGWFGVTDHAAYAPDQFPVFVHDAAEGRFYGFPEFETPGFKIGRYHHRGETTAPGALDRACHPEDEAALRAAVARYFPGADGPLLRSAACMFTNTPDEHFIIDRHPEAPPVLVVSPCSGHGFKFCSVVGEIVADLVTRDATDHDISAFRLARFAPSTPSRPGDPS
jgi:sarcosine oxidase